MRNSIKLFALGFSVVALSSSAFAAEQQEKQTRTVTHRSVSSDTYRAPAQAPIQAPVFQQEAAPGGNIGARGAYQAR